jgi:hypothetical protein
MRSEQVIVEKLRQLPPQQLAEVEDFVDFLMNKARKTAALDRLLSIAPALAQAGADPMSEDEAADLVREVRAARRSQQGN